MKLVIEIPDYDLGKLATIAERGLASDDKMRSIGFCISKAINEFIDKYYAAGGKR